MFLWVATGGDRAGGDRAGGDPVCFVRGASVIDQGKKLSMFEGAFPPFFAQA